MGLDARSRCWEYSGRVICASFYLDVVLQKASWDGVGLNVRARVVAGGALVTVLALVKKVAPNQRDAVAERAHAAGGGATLAASPRARTPIGRGLALAKEAERTTFSVVGTGAAEPHGDRGERRDDQFTGRVLFVLMAPVISSVARELGRRMAICRCRRAP